MILCSGARAHLRLLIFLCAGLAFSIVWSVAQTPTPAVPPAPAAPGQSYALLIGGIPGQGPYGKWYADWLARFQSYLTKSAHVPEANVTVLSGPRATFDAITAALGKFAQKAKPQDQLILFIVGHGEINGVQPTLTLAGPDPTAQQIAALLDRFPASNQVVLNFSASSGDFLKTLSAPGRVNISATSPSEAEAPIFAEFFLRGLESRRADADKNGTITLLEAFNWAAQQTPLWIARWQETDAGGIDIGDPSAGPSVWKASGKETVEIFQKLYTGVPDRKLDPASDAKANDAVVPLVPPAGDVTDNWFNNRVVDEHALLEDCGQGIGVPEIGDNGTLQPIPGQKPGDPGYLAGHTVLGQPSPLTP